MILKMGRIVMILKMARISLALPLLLIAGCMGVDGKYSSFKHGEKYGYPEMAELLGSKSTYCTLTPAQWEPVFVEQNVTTSRRVSNTLQSMWRKDQISFDKSTRTVTVLPPFCQR